MSKTTGPHQHRRAHGLWAFLSALVLITTVAPSRAVAQCTPTVSGSSGVEVGLILDTGTGLPAMIDSSTDRREHARISDELAQNLGITVTPDANVNPQIRVIVDAGTPGNGLLGSGLRATANFTVIETFDDPDDDWVVEIYAENRDEDEPDEADEDSGFFKLFEDNETVDLSTVTLTLFSLAPSETTTIENGSTSTVQHFCEPSENGTDSFEEIVTLETDKDFVLVVPHGGEIEGGTSEQIGPLEEVLKDDYAISANIWETAGDWDPSKLASEHFHITSKALNKGSFPGLETMLSRPPFASGQPFRYAASLHGFGKYQGNGLVFGGDAHPETKCFVARNIQQRLSDLGLGKIAYYVYDDDGNVMVDLADERGKTIPSERGSVGLTGRSSDNIVNRLAPNPNGADTDVGGMQIEESVPLRDDPVVSDLVARQIAHAFGQLIDDPTLLDPALTTQCDALVAGPTPPAGAITGRVWLDDGDGIQAGGDLGVTGVAVDLLVDGAIVDSTSTDSSGDYTFTGLTEADYAIRVNLPAAHGFGPQNAGGDDAFDSDVLETTGESAIYSITADGQNDVDLDAALVAIVTAEIGDRAWIDADGNGAQHPSEAGLPGVAVTLLDATDDSIVDQTVTDANGLYTFSLLSPGDYRLRFEGPTGYVLTEGVDGTDATDSDPNPITGETGIIAVTAGQVDDTRDSGFTVDCFDVTPVAFGSTWMVSDVFDENWTTAGFPETGWTPMQTIVGYGPSRVNSQFTPSDHTAYFRLTFEVDDPSLYDSLDLALYRDDGAFVYLNGTEVLRSNLPAGTLGPGTPALSHSEATITTPVAASLLLPGPNVLAVEVHNRNLTSFDLLFDLELSSRVCRPCLGQVTIPVDRDTFLEEDDSSPNGGASKVEIDNNEERSGLIAFPVAGVVPAGAEVLHAALEFWITDDSSHIYRFYPVLRAWDEAVATYAVASSGTGGGWEIAGAKGVSDRDSDRPVGYVDDTVEDALGVMVLNVEGRAVVEEWAADPNVNHGLIIPGDEGATNDFYFSSEDHATDPAPTLKVVYVTSCGG